MADAADRVDQPGELHVREAARLAGRSPETVRRWIWSGRLSARKQGNRLLVARGDLEALVSGPTPPTLREWLDRMETKMRRQTARSAGPPGANLVIEDRRWRSERDGLRAGT